MRVGKIRNAPDNNIKAEIVSDYNFCFFLILKYLLSGIANNRQFTDLCIINFFQKILFVLVSIILLSGHHAINVRTEGLIFHLQELSVKLLVDSGVLQYI